MGNIALNKIATAYSYIKPYAPSNAVDGNASTTTPTSRWLCNNAYQACWLCVDLGASYLVNRWVVKHMPVAGWVAPDYSNIDFTLQGSINGSSWVNVDPVTNNSATVVDRTLPTPVAYRYFRVYITKGLRTNPQMASIVEFEVYQAYSNLLSGLTVSAGTLTPAFSQTAYAYTDTVGSDVSGIVITPTAVDPLATIKINNVVSPNNQPKLVDIAVGVTNIVINVTAGDGTQNNYTIAVTRQGNADLKTLEVIATGMVSVPLNPAFDKSITSYTAKTDYDAETASYIPTTEDPQATIKLDGVSTPNGSLSGGTLIETGITSVLEVTSTSGNKKTYTVAVSKNTSAYLTSVTLTGKSAPSWNTPFARKTFSYSITASATPLTATVKKEDAAATLYVTCNGIVLNPTSSTGDTAIYSVSLNGGSNSLVIQVTSTSGDVKTYTFSIRK